MSSTRQRLTLHKSTIRSLDESELHGVFGGVPAGMQLNGQTDGPDTSPC